MRSSNRHPVPLPSKGLPQGSGELPLSDRRRDLSLGFVSPLKPPSVRSTSRACLAKRSLLCSLGEYRSLGIAGAACILQVNTAAIHEARGKASHSSTQPSGCASQHVSDVPPDTAVAGTKRTGTEALAWASTICSSACCPCSVNGSVVVIASLNHRGVSSMTGSLSTQITRVQTGLPEWTRLGCCSRFFRFWHPYSKGYPLGTI